MTREIVIDLDDIELLEALAKIEHEQWIELMRYILNYDISKEKKRWIKQMETRYENLSEEDKEKDRRFAREVIKAISDWWWKQE